MSSRKNKKRKQQNKVSGKINKATVVQLPDFLTSDRTFIIASFILAILYYSFSYFSTGFHQHDGAAHYLSMRGLWENPSGLFSNHKSAGFYMLYMVPAKLGLIGVKIWGSIVAAAACFLTYKVAKHYNKNIAFLAFIFLATQHWWVNFTFRTHVEVATAFTFILAAYLHQKEKFLWAGIVFGFLGAMRPELYIIGFGYFLYLAFFKRDYISALAVGIFPLFFHVTGWIKTGDPLFLLTALTGGPGAGTWSKAGFDHYLVFFSEVYGGLVVALFVCFLGSFFLSKEKKLSYLILLLPALGYVLMQCIFNLQAIPIGPYTGGTVRYIILVGPFLAVMAALGVAEVEKIPEKWKVLLFLLPLLLLTASFASYYLAGSQRTDTRDWNSTITIALAGLLILTPKEYLKLDYKYLLYGLFAVLSAYFTIKPYIIDYELTQVKAAAEWYDQEYGTNNGNQLYNNHTLFYYFLGKASEEIDPKPGNILNDEQIKTAPKGSIIMWESHYGYRPNRANFELQYTYFTERPEEYKLLKQFVAPNQRFIALFFEKLK